MFTQPAPGPAPTSPGLGIPAVSSSPVAASPASPTSRTSRLRSLNILRNYTQTHLLSRDHNSSTTAASNQPQSSSSATSPRSPLHLTRATSYPTTTTATAAAAANTSSPSPSSAADTPNTPSPSYLSSLVPTLTHPFGSAAQSRTAATTTTTITTISPSATAPPRRSTDSSLVPPIVTPATASGTTTRAAAATDPADPAATMTRARSATTSDSTGQNGAGGVDILPSIRFSTFYDPRATRPSLTFTPVSRTLPTGSEVIRVGRYSERDNAANIPVNVPSAAPVGFKSKVVSRRHCEFWYEGGKWYIKDVKSSSGTFLNHIRLSPPGTESKPFPINDGDIVQLGIDFKGGEEMIFRCVKMRLELNRGWQNKLNTFNMTTHKRLRNMTNTSGNNNSAQNYSQDCSICLNSIAPCQCLFVAPCSHTWHYKCIRALLASPSYPIFICPNCRAAADLEAEVEDPEEWEQLDSDEGDQPQQGAPVQNGEDPNAADAALPRRSRESARSLRLQKATSSRSLAPPVVTNDSTNGDLTVLLDSSHEHVTQASGSEMMQDNVMSTSDRPVAPNATSNPVPIPSPSAAAMHRAGDDARNLQELGTHGQARGARTPSPTGAPVSGHEGPITPRNDAGPWVFDGSGVRIRVSGDGGARVSSLGAAVAASSGPDSMEIS